MYRIPCFSFASVNTLLPYPIQLFVSGSVPGFPSQLHSVLPDMPGHCFFELCILCTLVSGWTLLTNVRAALIQPLFVVFLKFGRIQETRLLFSMCNIRSVYRPNSNTFFPSTVTRSIILYARASEHSIRFIDSDSIKPIKSFIQSSQLFCWAYCILSCFSIGYFSSFSLNSSFLAFTNSPLSSLYLVSTQNTPDEE